MNPKITRLKFTAFVAALFLLLILFLNIKATSAIGVILFLIILFLGLIPFLIGFILQIVLWRINVSSYIPWVVSSIILTYTTYLSPNPRALFFPDALEGHTIYKFLFFLVSIIVYASFMQLGVELSQKIKKRLQYNK